MTSLSYRGHRFPAAIIQHAIWLYLRFNLSYRDVEELLAERGLDLSYETIRRWVLKFGPVLARRLRQRRPRPGESLAFGRDGGAHRGQADVSLARRRPRGRDPRCPGPASSGQAGGRKAD